MPHVLIVEDDPDVREMLDVLLSLKGYSTTCAANGAEALDRVRERRPCVILLDLMMPVMSGWQFREAQLNDPTIAAVPVVCITAIYEREAVARSLQLRCLQKPVDFGDLLDAVRTSCEG